MKPVRTMVGVLLLGASFTGVVGGPAARPASAATCPVVTADLTKSFQSYFTVPDGTASCNSITDAIVAWVDRAQCGSSIKIAVFEVRDDGTDSEFDLVMSALSRRRTACLLNGPAIKVVLGHNNPSTSASKQAALQQLDAISDLQSCPKRCGGTTGWMHNKFLIISDVNASSGNQTLVLQMTSNWTNTQLKTKYHNAAASVYNSSVYDAYDDTFEALYSCAQGTCSNPATHDWAYGSIGFSDYPKASTDTTIEGQIGSTGCDPANAWDRIRVVMGSWNQDSNNSADHAWRVADKLWTKRTQGCDVKIIVNPGADIFDDAKNAGPTHPFNKLRSDGARVVQCTSDPAKPVHSKYVLTRGSSETKRVFVGSKNFTPESLWKNNETWLKIEDDAMFDQFEADWNGILVSAAACPDS